MEPAHSIIERLGGPKAVALAAGVSTKSVYCWRLPRERGGTAGIIPHWHVAALLSLSDRIGAGLSPADFAQRISASDNPSHLVDHHGAGPPP